MKKYILVSTLEIEPAVVTAFDTYEDAYEVMKEQFLEAAGYDSVEEMNEMTEYSMDECLREDYAWCETANHENAVWTISELEV